MSQTPTRIMFVDDEPRILDGLRRQFRQHRTGWSIRFLDSPQKALVALEEEPADVVISDMRMPDMNGATFLRRVQQRWPDTIRFILSGQTEQAALLDDIGAVHQYLQKPCEPAQVEEAVNRAARLAAIVDSPELRAITSSICSLPVSSSSYQTLVQVLEDPRSGAVDISRVVESDIGLATKLMQLANSAFFGLPRRITSVRDAVVLIGSNNLRELAVTANILDTLVGDCAVGPLIQQLWDVSSEIGGRAGRLAAENGQSPDIVSAARLSGVLSMIGRALFIRNAPDVYQDLMAKAQTEQRSLRELEVETFTTPQHAIGAYALGLWAFNVDVIEAILSQYDPTSSGVASRAHPAPYVHAARAQIEDPPFVEAVELNTDWLDELGVVVSEIPDVDDPDADLDRQAA